MKQPYAKSAPGASQNASSAVALSDMKALFSENTLIQTNTSLSWYAIHTKPRQEERAIKNLASWGIATLAPRLKGTQERRDPYLFPGYVFGRFDGLNKLHDIQFTRGVAYVVSFGGVPAPVSDEVIAEIYARMDESGIVRLATTLRPGDEVIIRSGPLRSFVGVFERDLPATERIQILLNAVAYSARVEVSRLDVTRAAPASL